MQLQSMPPMKRNEENVAACENVEGSALMCALLAQLASSSVHYVSIPVAFWLLLCCVAVAHMFGAACFWPCCDNSCFLFHSNLFFLLRTKVERLPGSFASLSQCILQVPFATYFSNCSNNVPNPACTPLSNCQLNQFCMLSQPPTHSRRSDEDGWILNRKTLRFELFASHIH
jgi:hypothetical protein